MSKSKSQNDFSFFKIYFDKENDAWKLPLDNANKYKKERDELWTKFDEIKSIEKDKSYYFLLFMGGAIPIDTKDLGDDTIENYAKAVNEVIQHNKRYILASSSAGVEWLKKGGDYAEFGGFSDVDELNQ